MRDVPRGLKHADATKVYSVVVATPGLTMRAIAAAAGLKQGLTRTHLQQLVEQRRVRVTDPYAPKYVAHVADGDLEPIIRRA